MRTRSAKRWLSVAFIWLVVVGSLAVLARHCRPPGENGKNNNVTEPYQPIKPQIVRKITVRFMSGTDEIMRFSQEAIDDLATELANDAGLHLRIIGHIAPGTRPAEEKKLTERQIGKLKGFFRDDRGIGDSRITLGTSKDPDDNGTYGVATCVVEKGG